ncbi:MAG TPA: hypothetical protein VEJ63_13615 [Planctomycetota bacterium]|nr:hypothetical protein [Planctomycetota bacterium]
MKLVPLFDNTALRELNVTLAGETFSLLVVADICALAHSDVKFPDDDIYWGELWPAALALSEAILLGDVGLPSTPRSILEIGCGTGLVSLSAARKLQRDGIKPDAPIIVAADREERALKLVAANAERNGLAAFISTQQIDWSGPAPARFPRVLAADCLYQPDSCWKLSLFVHSALADSSDCFGIVADPQRWSARSFPLHAQQAGLRVARSVRPVPLVRSHGPVESLAVESNQPTIQADLFELRK